MPEVDGEDRDTALEAAEAAKAGAKEVKIDHLEPGPSEEELAAEREATVAYVPPPMLVAAEAAPKSKAKSS